VLILGLKARPKSEAPTSKGANQLPWLASPTIIGFKGPLYFLNTTIPKITPGIGMLSGGSSMAILAAIC
jgi:hypothetical protein